MKASARLLFIAALVVSYAGAFQSPQPAADGLAGDAPFSLNVSAARSVVKAGSEVRVKIVLTNTSGSDLVLGRGNKTGDQGEVNYTIDVRDEKGIKAVETRYGHWLRTGEDPAEKRETVTVGTYHTVRLKPGDTVKEDAILGKLYDLSKTGKYTIQVQRRDEPSKTVVKSNKIIITVID